MSSKNKIPKDLGLKVASPEGALWIRTRDQTKELITENENSLILNRALLKLAEQKIKEAEKE